MGQCCSNVAQTFCPRRQYATIDGRYEVSYERVDPYARFGGKTKSGGGAMTVAAWAQPASTSRPQSIGGRGGGAAQHRHGNGGGYGRAAQGVHSKYDLTQQVIGVGSTSTVHVCIQRSTGKEFACKIIDKKNIESRFRGLLDQFRIEIGVLKTLNHPNIIHLEDVFETDTHIYMVMELMRGGELFDYIMDRGTLSEEEASDLVRKLASAIAYMHSLEIIHRDLKPENLLLTHKGPDAELKIIDFGLSKILSGTTAESFLGTRGYLAPEMLQRQTYTKPIDIWALGVIVFILLCGCLPFDDDSSKMSYESVQQKFQLRFPAWANNLSSGAKDLLVHLLDINPRTRFTAEMALSHPWVKGEVVKQNNYLQSPKGLRKIQELRGRANSGGHQRSASAGTKTENGYGAIPLATSPHMEQPEVGGGAGGQRALNGSHGGKWGGGGVRYGGSVDAATSNRQQEPSFDALNAYSPGAAVHSGQTRKY